MSQNCSLYSNEVLFTIANYKNAKFLHDFTFWPVLNVCKHLLSPPNRNASSRGGFDIQITQHRNPMQICKIVNNDAQQFYVALSQGRQSWGGDGGTR